MSGASARVSNTESAEREALKGMVGDLLEEYAEQRVGRRNTRNVVVQHTSDFQSKETMKETKELERAMFTSESRGKKHIEERLRDLVEEKFREMQETLESKLKQEIEQRILQNRAKHLDLSAVTNYQEREGTTSIVKKKTNDPLKQEIIEFPVEEILMDESINFTQREMENEQNEVEGGGQEQQEFEKESHFSDEEPSEVREAGDTKLVRLLSFSRNEGRCTNESTASIEEEKFQSNQSRQSHGSLLQHMRIQKEKKNRKEDRVCQPHKLDQKTSDEPLKKKNSTFSLHSNTTSTSFGVQRQQRAGGTQLLPPREALQEEEDDKLSAGDILRKMEEKQQETERSMFSEGESMNNSQDVRELAKLLKLKLEEKARKLLELSEQEKRTNGKEEHERLFDSNISSLTEQFRREIAYP